MIFIWLANKLGYVHIKKIQRSNGVLIGMYSVCLEVSIVGKKLCLMFPKVCLE